MKALQKVPVSGVLALLLLGGLLAWLGVSLAPPVDNFVLTLAGVFCGMGTVLLIVLIYFSATRRR